MATLIARTSGKSSPRYRGRRTQSVDRESSVLAYVWAFKSNHARLIEYRARKQAADRWDGRLLTRAVLYRCPNGPCPDLGRESIPLRELGAHEQIRSPIHPNFIHCSRH